MTLSRRCLVVTCWSMHFRFMTTELGHGKLRFSVIACLIVAAAMIALSQHMNSLAYDRDIRTEIKETHARLLWIISTHGQAETMEHIESAVHAAEAAHDRDVLFLSKSNGQYGSGNLAMLDRVESWRTLSIPGALFLAGPFERDSTKHEVVGLGKTLKNGEYLFVGYDVDEHRREELWRNAAVWLGFLALTGVLHFASVQHVRFNENQINRMGALLAAHGVQTPVKTNVDFATLVESANLLAEKLVQEKQIAGDAGSIAAHDLRAPLSRLQMELVGLGQQMSLPQAFADRFSNLVDETEKLISRFDSAVFLSKASRRKTPAMRATSDVAAVLQSVVELYEPFAEANGQSITVHALETVRVAVDENDLQRLFGNVIENACHHNAKGTIIGIICVATEKGANVEIADNGVGIAEAVLQGILQDQSASGGFGLPIVVALAKANAIHVEFTSDPQGFNVKFDIPYAE